MSASGNAATACPASVVIVGCGLIGTSLGLALRAAWPDVPVHGLDVDTANAQQALAMGAFTTVSTAWPNDTFELAVLAIPLDAACRALGTASEHAQWVVDVCSAKRPICDLADALGLRQRFVPTHPMAGRASGGPGEAVADLFADRAWILVDDWPATTHVEPFIRQLGARVARVPTAADHDAAMAAVSHAIHVTSLAAMLAGDEAAAGQQARWRTLTGPAFRDITRLAASPTEFWVDTLLANGDFVVQQLARLTGQLTAFQAAIASGDAPALATLLDDARTAHETWRP